MLTQSVVRRTGAAVAATAVAVSLAASWAATGSPAQAATGSSPAGRAASWSASQLTHGLVHNNQYKFDDYGLSIDTAFELKAIGGHGPAVHQIRVAMRHHVSDYTTDASFGYRDQYSSADAKLLVFAESTGGGARSFGGSNLVARLQRRVVTGGAARGRIHDVVDPKNTYGADFANTIGQVFAARGLIAAHSAMANPVLHYLLLQQCRSGYFRLNLGKIGSTHQSCTSSSPADNDVTSLAVVQLWPFTQGHPALRRSLQEAAGWLARHQGKGGGFSEQSSGVNANSTGLAAWALGSVGRCTAARRAAHWVTGLQRRSGAIAFDRADFRAAQGHGITVAKQDAWRRATSQAGPGLLYLTAAHCR